MMMTSMTAAVVDTTTKKNCRTRKMVLDMLAADSCYCCYCHNYCSFRLNIAVVVAVGTKRKKVVDKTKKTMNMLAVGKVVVAALDMQAADTTTRKSSSAVGMVVVVVVGKKKTNTAVLDHSHLIAGRTVEAADTLGWAANTTNSSTKWVPNTMTVVAAPSTTSH